jgi:hypothetical protein
MAAAGEAVASTPATIGAATGPQLAASWAGPLSTSGRYIVDVNGNRFKLEAGNWDGAQGHWTGSGSTTDPVDNHAGEVSYDIPLGLDRAPLPTILAGLHSLGVNAIRLPYADAMIHDTSAVPDVAVTANP